MDESFDTVFEACESAKAHQLGYLNFYMRPNRQLLHHRKPRIILQLLKTNADFFGFRVDTQHLDFNLLALGKDLAGIGHFLGPREITDVEQSVNPFFNLHKGAVIGQVPHNTFQRRTDGVALAQLPPWVRLRLFEPERDLFLLGVHAQDHHVYFLIQVQEFVGMAHPARPAHFTHVHHAFDALFKLYEGAVIRRADHAAAHNAAHRVPFLGGDPRVLRLLLEPEADTLGLWIEAEHHNVDPLAHLDRL